MSKGGGRETGGRRNEGERKEGEEKGETKGRGRMGEKGGRKREKEGDNYTGCLGVLYYFGHSPLVCPVCYTANVLFFSSSTDLSLDMTFSKLPSLLHHFKVQ